MAVLPIIEVDEGGVVAAPRGEALRCEGSLYIVDRSGHERKKPSLRAIERVSEGGRREVWADAAPLDPEDIIDLLVAGAAAVVVRQGQHHWRDLAIEAVGIAERVVVWMRRLEGDGAAHEVRWLMEKGISDFVVWTGSPSPLPEGARYFSRRKGPVAGCPPWVEWKLVEVERDGAPHGDSGQDI
ncbi:MAG: hypothetical protein L0Z54_03920 [Thermoplasmata archaeon]|nr:hypothetical protein [Thermoplasmata archaeon]